MVSGLSLITSLMLAFVLLETETSRAAPPVAAKAPSSAGASASSSAGAQAATAQKIHGLSWISQIFKTQMINERTRVFATVEGKYTEEDWTFLWDSRQIRRNATGNFRLTVPLTGPVTTVSLTAISPFGAIERSVFQIKYPEWDKVTKAKKPRLNRHFFSTSLGLSLLSYKETNQVDISQKGLTLKGSYSYLLKPGRWDFGANFYITALPFGSSQPESSVRFFGANARIGYGVPFIQEPWHVSIMTGLYYTTMFVSGPTLFGFESLMGPQLFPVITRSIGPAEAIGGYFKFSPVGQGFALSSLSNREIAGGLYWRKRLRGGTVLTVAMDIASLSLLIDDVAITSNSTSFSFGIGW